ncbi:MAG: hypothetical protein QJR14_07735 [Bacillota bacterium]|nr:hypothetical protein [Bacillota bacterium]
MLWVSAWAVDAKLWSSLCSADQAVLAAWRALCSCCIWVIGWLSSWISWLMIDCQSMPELRPVN